MKKNHGLSQWEMAIFDLWQNRHASTDHQNIYHMWLRQRRLQLCHNWYTFVNVGFWASGWNITIFYLYLFWGTHLQVGTVDRFSRMMAQATRTHARMCLFRLRSPPNLAQWWILALIALATVKNSMPTLVFRWKTRWNDCAKLLLSSLLFVVVLTALNVYNYMWHSISNFVRFVAYSADALFACGGINISAKKLLISENACSRPI